VSLEASCRLSGLSFTMSSYSSWDLHLVQFIVSSISREALHGVPFSLVSPCWSLLVCAFLGLRRLIDAKGFFLLRNSTWILYHFAYYQRTCLRRVLFVLPAVQVSFLVCVPTTPYNRHWRPILSQGPATHFCGPVRPTSVPLCAVLPR
jgi:hypothetical protein